MKKKTTAVKSKKNSAIKSMKSKKTQKSSDAIADVFNLDDSKFGDIGPDVAVGFRPVHELTPAETKRVRIFQKNLLSLLSHELRTPLMGVQNGLWMAIQEKPEIEKSEGMSMALRNLTRLSQNLNHILELAQWEEEGGIQPDFAQFNLSTLLKAKCEEWKSALGALSKIGFSWSDFSTSNLIWADEKKWARGFDLVLELLVELLNEPIAEAGSERASVSIEIQKDTVGEPSCRLKLSLDRKAYSRLLEAFQYAEVALRGGIASAGSVFGGVMLSESDFLSRAEEGLGSQMLAVKMIFKAMKGDVSFLLHGESRAGSDDLASLTNSLPVDCQIGLAVGNWTLDDKVRHWVGRCMNLITEAGAKKAEICKIDAAQFALVQPNERQFCLKLQYGANPELILRFQSLGRSVLGLAKNSIQFPRDGETKEELARKVIDLFARQP